MGEARSGCFTRVWASMNGRGRPFRNFPTFLDKERPASPSDPGSCCTCHQRLIIRAALKTKEEDGRHLSSWRGTLTKSSNVEIAALERDSISASLESGW